MPKIKYIGSSENFSELAYTGKQSVWKIAQAEWRPDAEAYQLMGTGQFEFDAQPVVAVAAANGTTNFLAGPIMVTAHPSNDIGTPGQQGFGVGICPVLPTGYSALYGTQDPAGDNYGNYQYSDGSIMVWVPAFYFRLGHTQNPTFATYGANSIDVKSPGFFTNEAAANAQGYYLHRAFVNAGANQIGFFRDKYDCSQNGTVASSIARAMPMVSAPGAGQVGFTGCTANGQTPVNAYYGALQAAKSRGAKFFPESVFMADALARISEAHAQASKAATFCAWYDAAGITNFVKGNNNNALKDINDTTVTYITAGASSQPNMAQTGSGSPFAKTTHNGQACGIADTNGNIYKINPGMTSIAVSKAITAATQANPVSITSAAHGYVTGTVVNIRSVVGMTQINDRFYTVTVVDANTYTLDGVDGTGYTAYTSGGTGNTGIFYTLKTSVDIAAVTSGASTATDHWGAAGVAAQFDAVTVNFTTAAAANTNSTKFGNGTNAVFDMSTANGRALTMLGLPAAGGTSAAGISLFGSDEFYQYILDQLCVLSRGSWSNGGNAGVRTRALNSARASAGVSVGFCAASYL
jgi:hypothetical protein